MEDLSKELLIRAAEGDMAAFERVYMATSDFVYNIAYRITNNREDAQEVTQDVFLKVHKNLPGFGFRSSFKTWLYRIGVNMAINAYNKRTRRSGREVRFDDRFKA